MKDFNSNKYFIDTNVFIRIFIKDDEKIFNDCLEFLNLVRENKILAYTHTLVLSEINWVLRSCYQQDKSKRLIIMESVVKLKNLKISNDSNFLLALELYKKHKAKFIDCLLASSDLLSEEQLIIVSYDKDFDKLGVQRIEPGEIK